MSDHTGAYGRIGDRPPQTYRDYRAHAHGDAINSILAAVGYNFRLILKWIRRLSFKFRVIVWWSQSENLA